ncbi:hypothetical protein DM01DRAFT_1339135 [Hesseltinella vesiculosa]|uniref:Transmembrane 9 superfamily member n=1 Tax=Hesseltinella vesiculosa TaxID=101127 RepID=A0A1X2G878_9FUNG|nr:hypothetical protein DM01DRAFT_1339135 [Hesseltinella vesiculosa]
MRRHQLIHVVWFLSVWLGVHADEHSHRYTKGEEVVIWMNTIGPLYNRQETYPFFQLPFCFGDSPLEHHHETLGEALQGMDLINSGIPVRFLEEVNYEPYCQKTLQHDDIEMFRYAVHSQYWYTMFVDDLPVGGFIGAIEDPDSAETMQYHLFTHKSFLIEYNQDRIIAVTLQETATQSSTARLDHKQPSLPITFTYSVTWRATTDTFQDRFSRLLESDFFEHQVHWLSICSSFMMVIFLLGLVSTILIRTLKNDYARYDREPSLADFDRDFGDDWGWKQVHGDVFRRPDFLMVLSALLGSGSQLVILAGVVILYTMLGDLYVERATILTATIFLYALTSAVSGYTSARFYVYYGGKQWVHNVLLTASLWPGVLLCIGGYINLIAVFYSSSKAIAFPIMVAMLAIWLFLCFPLTLLGAIIGRNYGATVDFPCSVHAIPRPIPSKPWFVEPTVLILMGGVLPFASIFIEIYFIFTSFWTYRIYYVYGFMLFVFLILLMVCACVSIVITYFLLNSEDHRWHWVSFWSCASTAGYVYAYAIYYYFVKTKMTGLFQTSFYFGYCGLLCTGLALMLGFIGYMASTFFVRRIYRNVKID